MLQVQPLQKNPECSYSNSKFPKEGTLIDPTCVFCQPLDMTRETGSCQMLVISILMQREADEREIPGLRVVGIQTWTKKKKKITENLL